MKVSIGHVNFLEHTLAFVTVSGRLESSDNATLDE